MSEYLKVSDKGIDPRYLPVEVIYADVIPQTDDLYTLGSLTKRWKELYLSQLLKVADSGYLQIGETEGAPQLKLWGVEANVAMVNIQPETGDRASKLGLVPSGASNTSGIHLLNSSDLNNYGCLSIEIAGDALIYFHGEYAGAGSVPTEAVCGFDWNPLTDNARNLGSSARRWKSLYLSDTIRAIGSTDLVTNLNADLWDGHNWGDALPTGAYPDALLRDGSRTVAGNLLPDGNLTRNLGSDSYNFNEIHARYVWGESGVNIGCAAGYVMGLAADGAYKLRLTASELRPESDNAISLGNASYRYSDIYAVTTHFGDICFEEKTCPICGKPFKKGDALVNYVTKVDKGGTHTIPAHLRCALKKEVKN